MAKLLFPQYAKGREGIDIQVGASVLQHIRRIGGVEIDSECGGKGICGKDIIRVEEGLQYLTEINDVEKHFLEQHKLKSGQRLACQAKVVSDTEDIKVFIPNFGRYTILTDTTDTGVEFDPHGLGELQRAVIDGVNESLEELEKQLEVEEGEVTGNIYDVVTVGNSTMRSIFFGQNVHDLGVIPFEPTSKQAITKKAVGLGLKVHPEAMAYGPPLIGGHAGADCVADIISTRLYESGEIEMIIDIGTNGEVVIGNRDRIMTASCAAGGAYEGYQIKCGVGAIQGAITGVKIEDGKAKYKTLGDTPPLGICGSGVIDLLAELFRTGIMNERARIDGDFHLTDRVFVSQDDINQLIMAKAGLRADQDLLVKYYGTNLDEVARIYLAGAFGNYMNVDSAVAIGLLPRTDKGKYIRFGNGALAGARDMLLSQQRRRHAEQLKDFVEHTKPNEIEGAEFQYLVAERIYFE